MGKPSSVANRVAFPLLDDIVVLTDAAMTAGKPKLIVPRLVSSLQGLLGNIGELPAELLQADSRQYLRRELYRSPKFGYRIFAMTWGPG